LTQDCVFCRILAGELPASLVHEDQNCVVLMDIQPVTQGHMLVIPRAHAPNLAALDPRTGGHLFQVGQRTAAALYASGLPCEGVNLFLADGEAAGQDVFHVHLHVFPRFEGDGFGLKFAPSYFELPPRQELDDAAAQIRRNF
jgi:histidine triad (HIT) family protein